MPWCLDCSNEYSEPAVECPECGKPLSVVGGLEEYYDDEERKWVPIRAVGDAAHAEAIKGMLETNGLDVLLKGGASRIPSIFGADGGPGSLIHIYVQLHVAGHAAFLVRSEMNWSEDELVRFIEEHDSVGLEPDEDIKRLDLSGGGYDDTVELY